MRNSHIFFLPHFLMRKDKDFLEENRALARNGLGKTIRVSGSSGQVSAQGQEFSQIKSIKRLGCPKGGVAPYVIITAISAVILVVAGVGIFFKKRKKYLKISNGDGEQGEHVSQPSDGER